MPYYHTASVRPRRSVRDGRDLSYTMFGILMIFFWMAYCTSCALL
jgi:hypothetical protein